ncbi:MAG TPA: hypothetical protein VFX97_04160 [Pyrinomonadaceae bacterium]|nr:hypothetical protein [Pyrinomonadaceae bacterium]
MASLRVPDKYVGGLAKFLSLSDEDSERALALLEGLSVSVKPRRTIKEAFLSAATIAPNEADSIADAVMSLFTIFNYEFKSPTEAARNIAEAIEESSAEELKDEDIRKKAEPRLTRLFSATTLAVSVKAEARRFDYDKVFAYARISSDIRPIFSDNATELPRAAVVSHMMNIHYISETEHKDFYVVLDDIDLKELQHQVERAVLKSENLQSLLRTNNIECLPAE